LPGFTLFHQESADQAQTRRCVGKDAHNPGSAADLSAKPFQHIGGADAPSVSSWEGENR